MNQIAFQMENATAVHHNIHQILLKRQFYFLPMSKIQQVMTLLKLKPSNSTKEIQASIISALANFAVTVRQQYSAAYLKDKKSNYFLEKGFRTIPKQAKEYVSSIIRDILDSKSQVTNQQPQNTPFNFTYFPRYYMLNDMHHFAPTFNYTHNKFELPVMYVNNYQPMQTNSYQMGQNLMKNYQNIASNWGQNRLNMVSDNDHNSQRVQGHGQQNDKEPINQVDHYEQYQNQNQKNRQKSQIDKKDNEQVSLKLKDRGSYAGLNGQSLQNNSKQDQKQNNHFQGNKDMPLELELKFQHSISDLDYRNQVNQTPVQRVLEQKLLTELIAKQAEDAEPNRDGKQQTMKDLQGDQSHRQKKEQIFAMQEVNQTLNHQNNHQLLNEQDHHSYFPIQNQGHQPDAHFLKDHPLSPHLLFNQPVEPTEELFINCPCQGKYQGKNGKCFRCCGMYHFHCLSIQDSNAQIECPKCKIKAIDPLTATKTILGEYYLQDINNQKFETELNLSEYEYLNRKEYRHTNRVNEIQMRCVKLPTNNQINEVSWPDQLQIYVNSIRISTIYSLSVASLLKKRKDNPLIITNAISKFKSEDDENPERVKIGLQIVGLPPAELAKKRINNQFTFLLGIYLTEKIRPEVLYQTIKSSIQSCGEHYIQSLMELAQESQIDIEKEQFTITDPYTGSIINFPVRGIFCKHAQCFDLATHLCFMSAMKVRGWKCPICSKQAKKFTADYQIQEMIANLSAKHIIPNRISMIKHGDTVLKVSIDSASESSEEEEHKKKPIKKKKLYRPRHKQVNKHAYFEYIYSQLLKKVYDEDIERYLVKEESKH